MTSATAVPHELLETTSTADQVGKADADSLLANTVIDSALSQTELPPTRIKLSEVTLSLASKAIHMVMKIEKGVESNYNPRLPDGSLNVDGVRSALRDAGAKDETVEDLMSYLRANVAKLESSRVFRMDREPLSWRALVSAIGKHTRWDTPETRSKYAEVVASFVGELAEEFKTKRELTVDLRKLKHALKADTSSGALSFSSKDAHPFSKVINATFERAVNELSVPGKSLSEESIAELKNLQQILHKSGDDLRAVGGRPFTLEEIRAFHNLSTKIKGLHESRISVREAPQVSPETTNVRLEPAAIKSASAETVPEVLGPSVTAPVEVWRQGELQFDHAVISDLEPTALEVPLEPVEVELAAPVTPVSQPAPMSEPSPSLQVERAPETDSILGSALRSLVARGRDMVVSILPGQAGREDRQRTIEVLNRQLPRSARSATGSELIERTQSDVALREELLAHLKLSLAKSSWGEPEARTLTADKIKDASVLEDGREVWVCGYPDDATYTTPGRYKIALDKTAWNGRVLVRDDGVKDMRELTPRTLELIRTLPRSDFRAEIMDNVAALGVGQGWQLKLLVPAESQQYVNSVVGALRKADLIQTYERSEPANIVYDETKAFVEYTLGVGDGARIQKIAAYLSTAEVLGLELDKSKAALKNWYPQIDGLHFGRGIAAIFSDGDPEYSPRCRFGLPLPLNSSHDDLGAESLMKDTVRSVVDKSRHFSSFLFAALENHPDIVGTQIETEIVNAKVEEQRVVDHGWAAREAAATLDKSLAATATDAAAASVSGSTNSP